MRFCKTYNVHIRMKISDIKVERCFNDFQWLAYIYRKRRCINYCIWNEIQLDKPIRIVLSLKDQRSADTLGRDLSCLSKKIGNDLYPVFTSRKMIKDIKVVEAKPPLINQHRIVYKFKCDLCDTDYVGYTSRHLFQRITEHKHSIFGKHLKEDHNLCASNLQDQKCRTKLDCLIYEMLFIRNIKPKFNTQSDSFMQNFSHNNWILTPLHSPIFSHYFFSIYI